MVVVGESENIIEPGVGDSISSSSEGWCHADKWPTSVFIAIGAVSDLGSLNSL